MWLWRSRQHLRGVRQAFFMHHFEIFSSLFPFLCNMLVYATCFKLNCLGWTTGLCDFLLLIYFSVVQFMFPSLLKCFCNISLCITKEWIVWNKPPNATHTMCQKTEEPTLSHTSSTSQGCVLPVRDTDTTSLINNLPFREPQCFQHHAWYLCIN